MHCRQRPSSATAEDWVSTGVDFEMTENVADGPFSPSRTVSVKSKDYGLEKAEKESHDVRVSQAFFNQNENIVSLVSPF